MRATMPCDPTQIKLIGKIVDVRDGNSWCYMTIHDGTGSIEIKHFLDDTDWVSGSPGNPVTQ